MTVLIFNPDSEYGNGGHSMLDLDGGRSFMPDPGVDTTYPPGQDDIGSSNGGGDED